MHRAPLLETYIEPRPNAALCQKSKTAIKFSEELARVDLKISGCPNAWGPHPLTTVGLYGAHVKSTAGRSPLQLTIRWVSEGEICFGQLGTYIPAKCVPEALIEAYRRDRQPGESFPAWTHHLQETGQLKAWGLTVVKPFLAVDRLSDLNHRGQQDLFLL